MKTYKINSQPKIIILCGKNYVSTSIWDFLEEQNENIVKVFKEPDLITADIISSYRPDIIITCYWPFLLKPEIFNIPQFGCINFHPGLLPLNRGWYPAMWPFIDGSQAGVTLHLIDEGADTGPILAQATIDLTELDDLGTIYSKSQELMISLFKDTWMKIKSDGIQLIEQSGNMTYHSKTEGNNLNEIKLDDTYKVQDLFNILKSRMFGDKSFAYYIKDGKKYTINFKINDI